MSENYSLKDLQQFAEELTVFYCKKYKMRPIKIKVKNITGCGRARPGTRSISIPIWSYEQGGLDYFTAYVLHEISHFITHDIGKGSMGHCNYFFCVEKKLCSEWGLVLKNLKKCYYARLEDTEGNLLWLWNTTVRIAAGIKPCKLKGE